jgi:hypothetical protein
MSGLCRAPTRKCRTSTGKPSPVSRPVPRLAPALPDDLALDREGGRLDREAQAARVQHSSRISSASWASRTESTSHPKNP